MKKDRNGIKSLVLRLDTNAFLNIVNILVEFGEE